MNRVFRYFCLMCVHCTFGCIFYGHTVFGVSATSLNQKSDIPSALPSILEEAQPLSFVGAEENPSVVIHADEQWIPSSVQQIDPLKQVAQTLIELQNNPSSPSSVLHWTITSWKSPQDEIQDRVQKSISLASWGSLPTKSQTQSRNSEDNPGMGSQRVLASSSYGTPTELNNFSAVKQAQNFSVKEGVEAELEQMAAEIEQLHQLSELNPLLSQHSFESIESVFSALESSLSDRTLTLMNLLEKRSSLKNEMLEVMFNVTTRLERGQAIKVSLDGSRVSFNNRFEDVSKKNHNLLETLYQKKADLTELLAEYAQVNNEAHQLVSQSVKQENLVNSLKGYNDDRNALLGEILNCFSKIAQVEKNILLDEDFHNVWIDWIRSSEAFMGRV